MATNSAASSIAMARNVLKSAMPAVTSTPSMPPPIPISQETLKTAREVLQSASEDAGVPVGTEFLPGFQLFQNLFKGSFTIVSHSLEKIHLWLRSAGDMGKKLLGIIQENPTKAIVVTGGVLLVVALGVRQYKYYLVTVPPGGEQGLLAPSSEETAPSSEVEPGSTTPILEENFDLVIGGIELQELNLMRCPITEAPFQDPVVAADGHTYERYAIEHWFRSGQRISPITAQPLNHMDLTPNFLVLQTQEQLLGQLLSPSA